MTLLNVLNIKLFGDCAKYTDKINSGKVDLVVVGKNEYVIYKVEQIQGSSDAYNIVYCVDYPSCKVDGTKAVWYVQNKDLYDFMINISSYDILKGIVKSGIISNTIAKHEPIPKREPIVLRISGLETEYNLINLSKLIECGTVKNVVFKNGTSFDVAYVRFTSGSLATVRIIYPLIDGMCECIVKADTIDFLRGKRVCRIQCEYIAHVDPTLTERKPSYVPFTSSDVEKVIGKVVRYKRNPTYIHVITGIMDESCIIDGIRLQFTDALERIEFLDETPFGKLSIN